jgi:hypothetical protein
MKSGIEMVAKKAEDLRVVHEKEVQARCDQLISQ